MTEILNYRYIGQTGEGEDSSKPSPSQFQLYVKDSRKDEDEGWLQFSNVEVLTLSVPTP